MSVNQRKSGGAAKKVVVSLVVGLAALAISAAPALAAFPEAPVTEAPSPIAGTTATFKGELNSGLSAEKVTYRFAYSPGLGAACTESGLTAPAEPFPEAEGNHKAVSVPVTGLEGGTEYTVCLVAASPVEPAELTQGSSVTFKTLPEKPLVVSESSGGLTPFSATLSAEVNPENQATTECEFEYGKTIAYGTLGACEPSTLEGPSTQTVSFAATELEAATTYHYRLVVKNATGETKGLDGEFTTETLKAPSIDGESSSGVTQSHALLSALVNPNYQTTSWQFKLGTNTSYTLGTFPAMAGTLSAAFGDQEVRAGTGGVVLAPNTEYHYEVTATNGAGTSEGLTAPGIEDKTFLTLPRPPTVSTEAASAVTASTASIAGSVDPGSVGVNSATTYYFQYGTSTGYGSQSPVVPGSVGEGTSPVFEQAQLSGLEPGRTYHYRIVASNDNANTAGGPPQVVYGEDATFSTTAIPIPLVETGGAGGVAQTTASVSAVVDDRGSQTSYELDLGTDTSYGAKIFGNAGAGSGPEAVTVALVELTPGTTYHYRFIATSSFGVAYGADRTFTTPGFPVGLPAAPATAVLVPVSATVFPTEAADTGSPIVKPKPTKCKRGFVRKHGRCARKPKGKKASIHAGIRGGK